MMETSGEGRDLRAWGSLPLGDIRVTLLGGVSPRSIQWARVCVRGGESQGVTAKPLGGPHKRFYPVPPSSEPFYRIHSLCIPLEIYIRTTALGVYSFYSLWYIIPLHSRKFRASPATDKHCVASWIRKHSDKYSGLLII
jgi:hypothetical protein